MNDKFDPRTKLFVVLITSTLILVLHDIRMMAAVLLFQFIFALVFKAKIYETFYKLRRFISILFFLIVIQSIFDNQGNTILAISNITVLTDQGIIKGIAYIIRLTTIIMSGAILVTSEQSKLIQALVLIKVPYDLALMSSMGIRFLPLLIEQMKDTLTAIQLRGVEIEKQNLRDKLSIYAYIFTPVIVSTLKKAKSLSLSIEMRAFRLYEKRTSLVKLELANIDYYSMGISFVFAFGIVLTSFL